MDAIPRRALGAALRRGSTLAETIRRNAAATGDQVQDHVFLLE